MKKKRILSAGIILGTTALLLSACGNQQQNQENRLYIGVTYYNQSDTFLNEMLDSFKAQLEEMEVGGTVPAVTVRDAAGLQKTQNDQVKELIDAGCNVLCVNLVDRADPSDIIDLAREYDVPIIFFNREPVEEDMNRWEKLYYVGADAKESAVLQGDILVDAYNQDTRTLDANGNGLVSYVLLEGETSHQDSLIRTEWSIQTLKDGGVPLEKITGGIANWDRSQASALMEQWLKEYTGQIELVVSNNDDMALGAIDAINRAGIGANSIKVVGIDGTPVGIKALEEGYLFGTVESDKERYSRVIFDIAWSLSLNQDPKDRVPQLDGNYYWCPQRALTQAEAKLLKNQ